MHEKHPMMVQGKMKAKYRKFGNPCSLPFPYFWVQVTVEYLNSITTSHLYFHPRENSVLNSCQPFF
jgi:hypothetical protein